MMFRIVEPPQTYFYAMEAEHKRQIAIAIRQALEADPDYQRQLQQKRDQMRARIVERRSK